jgi:O-antigen/teichoic acid export membrane protein
MTELTAVSNEPPDVASDVLAQQQVSRRSATLVNVAYQYTSVALTIVRGILMLPLFLKYIGNDLYGAWLASGNIVGWLTLSAGGAWLLLRQQTSAAFSERDGEKLARVIGAGLTLLTTLAITSGALGLLFTGSIAGWLKTSGSAAHDLGGSFALAVIAMAMNLISGGPMAVQQGFQRHLAVGTIAIGAELVSLVLTIVWLYRGWGLWAISIPMIVREILLIVLLTGLMLTTLRTLHIRPIVRIGEMRRMFHLMGWTFLNSLGDTFRRNCDSLFIARFIDNGTVVIATTSMRLWEVIQLFLTRASNAFTPAMAHLYASGDEAKFREIARRLFLVLVAGIALAAAVAWVVNAPLIPLWTRGRAEFAGWTYNYLLGFAAVASTLVFAVGEMLFARGDIRVPAIIQFVQNLSRVALLLIILAATRNILAIPISILIACGLIGLPPLWLRWRRTMRGPSTKRESPVWQVIRCVGIAAVLSLAGVYLPQPKTWLMLGVEAAAFATAALAALYVVEPEIRTYANARWKRRVAA